MKQSLAFEEVPEQIIRDHFEDNLAVTTALGIRSIGRHKSVAFAEASVNQLILINSPVHESLVDSLCSTYRKIFVVAFCSPVCKLITKYANRGYDYLAIIFSKNATAFQ